jgi:hypothetical protein
VIAYSVPSGDRRSHSMNARKTWTNLPVRDASKWTAKSIRRRAHPQGKPSNEIGHPAIVNEGIVAPARILVKDGANRTFAFWFRSTGASAARARTEGEAFTLPESRRCSERETSERPLAGAQFTEALARYIQPSPASKGLQIKWVVRFLLVRQST